MAYNGSGGFNLYTPGNPVVTGTTISSAWANNTLNDIATGLSTAITKNGQTAITANIPFGGFKITGLGAGTADGNSLRYEQLFSTAAVTLLGAMNWVKGADIASASTINLTTATGNGVHITGTTTITAVTLGSGMWRLVVFDGVLTLTHHATNNNLPGGANITTAAGDRALYWSDGTKVYCAVYQSASGNVSASQLQAQTYVAFTTGGTSTAYTLTPSPAITAYVPEQSFFVSFHTTCGAAPTLTINGIGTPPNLVKQIANGGYSNLASGDISGGHRSRVTMLTSSQALVEDVPPKFDSLAGGLAITSGVLSSGTVMSAAVNTTSGTSISFSGIPATVSAVRLKLYGVSLDGTGIPGFQLGDAGGIETTGYSASASFIPNASNTTTVFSTTYFPLTGSNAATSFHTGTAHFRRLAPSSNVWIYNWSGGQETTITSNAGGYKELSAELTQINIMTAANNFDAGQAAIEWDFAR